MTAITLVSPWVLKYAIDDLHVGVTHAKLRLYASLLLGLALVGGVFRYGMRRIIIGISRDIEYDVRNDFFAHLERLPLTYFQTHRTGELMSRATNDLSAVRMMVGPAVMYSVNTGLVFVVALVLMLSIDLPPDARVARAAAAGVDRRQGLRQRHSPPLRTHSGAAGRDERRDSRGARGRPGSCAHTGKSRLRWTACIV